MTSDIIMSPDQSYNMTISCYLVIPKSNMHSTFGQTYAIKKLVMEFLRAALTLLH